jgi:hypothetical protein
MADKYCVENLEFLLREVSLWTTRLNCKVPHDCIHAILSLFAVHTFVSALEIQQDDVFHLGTLDLTPNLMPKVVIHITLGAQAASSRMDQATEITKNSCLSSNLRMNKDMNAHGQIRCSSADLFVLDPNLDFEPANDAMLQGRHAYCE